MIHEMRQNFIHEEAKKLREKLNCEMNTPQSFDIVKAILDKYDEVNGAKLENSNCNIPLVSESVCYTKDCCQHSMFKELCLSDNARKTCKKQTVR